MSNSPELFLVDANSLITPFLTFYPFDFAEDFWVQLAYHINEGSIVVLDMVKNEIEHGKDELSKWMKGLQIEQLVDHRDPSIVEKYSEVLEHVQDNNCYKTSALMEWARNTVADPWLIATGMVYGYTIITFEAPIHGLNSQAPSKMAKIPDVCSAFDVKTENLYYMMRKLSIRV